MRDDAVQTAIADATLNVEAFFVSHGVLMELGWVLRSAAGWDRVQINQAMRLLLSLPGATVDMPGLINWALERHLAGADWADMLHLDRQPQVRGVCNVRHGHRRGRRSGNAGAGNVARLNYASDLPDQSHGGSP